MASTKETPINSTYGGAIQYTDTGRSSGSPLDATVRHVVESAHIFKDVEYATRHPIIYITHQSQKGGHTSPEGVSTKDQFYSATMKNVRNTVDLMPTD